METTFLQMQSSIEELQKKNSSLEGTLKDQSGTNKLLQQKVKDLNQKIDYLEEKETIWRQTAEDGKSENPLMSLKSSFDDLENKYNKLQEKSTLQNRENESMKLKVEDLTTKIDTQEKELTIQIQNSKQTEHQENENKYQSIINQQAAEIKQLKIQLEAKDTLAQLKESFEQKLRDSESQRSSRRKQEKLEEKTLNDDIKREIKEVPIFK